MTKTITSVTTIPSLVSLFTELFPGTVKTADTTVDVWCYGSFNEEARWTDDFTVGTIKAVVLDVHASERDIYDAMNDRDIYDYEVYDDAW